MDGGTTHTVRSGQCLSSIAAYYGLFWETIWLHERNLHLRKERRTHNQLHPGDQIFIPARRRRQVSAGTESRHRFRRKGIPLVFCLRLMEYDKPIANEPYELHVDEATFQGTTSSDGLIEHHLPPDAQQGRLCVPRRRIDLDIEFGLLEPVGSVAGVQARLKNLGHDCGEIDGIAGPKTEACVAEFRRKHDLPLGTKIDAQLRSKLVEIHGN